MSDSIYKVIILGSGAAGLTAAIYAARADLNPLVIEGMQPGGQLTITTDVENYPGFADGIMGPDLMATIRKQAERFGTKILSGDVTQVDLKQRPFKIFIDKKCLETQTLIIATGATAQLLGLESEKRLMGHGVSACATCDGFFFKGKEVVIIGGGDTALEEATFLTKFCSKVSVVHRRDQLRASKIMQQKAFDNQKIEFVWDSVVEDIIGEPATGVKAVRLKNIKTSQTVDFDCQGVFVAIGHKPNTALFEGQISLDEKGYIISEGRTSNTNIPGVFAAGDVQDHRYRQAITAAGTGCMAAIDAERYLEANETLAK